jgi:hypothetical protein
VGGGATHEPSDWAASPATQAQLPAPADSAGEEAPAGQGAQADTSAYVEIGQGVHASDPAGLTVPAAQGAHARLAFRAVPAGHGATALVLML